MGRPLKSQQEIMEFTGFGRKMLAKLIEQYRFPHFYAGRNMCSEEDAITLWFREMALAGIKLAEEDENSTPQGEQFS